MYIYQPPGPGPDPDSIRDGGRRSGGALTAAASGGGRKESEIDSPQAVSQACRHSAGWLGAVLKQPRHHCTKSHFC